MYVSTDHCKVHSSTIKIHPRSTGTHNHNVSIYFFSSFSAFLFLLSALLMNMDYFQGLSTYVKVCEFFNNFLFKSNIIFKVFQPESYHIKKTYSSIFLTFIALCIIFTKNYETSEIKIEKKKLSLLSAKFS